jgi:hypothetical protein
VQADDLIDSFFNNNGTNTDNTKTKDTASKSKAPAAKTEDSDTQDISSLSSDNIDSLFSTDNDTTVNTQEAAPPPITLFRPGFSLGLSGSANAGGYLQYYDALHAGIYDTLAPDKYKAGVMMNGSFNFDAQFSRDFHMHLAYTLYFPGFDQTSPTEFYMDYNPAGKVYFRAGKFVTNWGIAQNYPSCNIVNRVPSSGWSGDPYLFRMDVPIGIGGIEAVGVLRNASTSPSPSDVGAGLKYNLAFNKADIDIGTFYQNLMPWRSYASFKTTLPGDFETYMEVMCTVPQLDRNFYWHQSRVSADIGTSNTFCDDKLKFNIEVYYNGELTSGSIYQKQDVESAVNGHDTYNTDNSPFYPEWNTALNLGWNFGGPHNVRLAVSWLQNIKDNSGRIIPALTMDLTSGVSLNTFATFILGPDKDYGAPNTNPCKFSLFLGITVSGSFTYSHYK